MSLRDLHDGRASGEQLAEERVELDVAFDLLGVDHPLAFGGGHIDGVDPDVTDPSERQRLHPGDDDLAVEQGGEHPVSDLGRCAMTARKTGVDDDPQRERRDEGASQHDGPRGMREGEKGAPPHQKASPIPNAIAIGAPRRSAGSRSKLAPLGYCSPGMR